MTWGAEYDFISESNCAVVFLGVGAHTNGGARTPHFVPRPCVFMPY